MYDYIVVGAGSAGCVVASRLSADPAVSVLLIEAGPEPTNPWIKIPAGMSRLYMPGATNWGYTSLPEPYLNNRQIYWPRGKTLGGSSAINGMLYVRGNPLDFDDWAQRGNTGWSWEDLLPLFKRGEDYQHETSNVHGKGGELAVSDPVMRAPFSEGFIRAAVNSGHKRRRDFNDGTQDGVGFLQFTIRNGSRASSYESFIKPVRGRKNLEIVTEALTERIEFSDRRATGVVFSRHGTKVTATARREIILCGGVINSPQLLMLSGIGPGDHLREFGIATLVDLPGVGGNLHDHLYTNLVLKADQTSQSTLRAHYSRLKPLGVSTMPRAEKSPRLCSFRPSPPMKV